MSFNATINSWNINDTMDFAIANEEVHAMGQLIIGHTTCILIGIDFWYEMYYFK